MDVDSKTDVLIIGGGPAGCAAAIALKNQRPELSVKLIEKSQYQAFRIGETLPPGCDELLRQLRIWQDFLKQPHQPSYGTQAAWGSDQLHDNEFIFNVSKNGWHLDRKSFDAFLFEQAKIRGATVLQDQAFTSDETTAARFTIDATGRQCVFARSQGAKRQYADRLMATWAILPAKDVSYSNTVVEAVENGWWYSALLPDKQLIVSFMTDADHLKQYNLKSVDAWLENLKRSQHTKARISTDTGISKISSCAADSAILDKIAGENWIAAGDAASTFDPLSSQGIFKSLRSGIFAAYATMNYFDNELRGIEKYRWLVENEYQEYLKQRQYFYRLENRWPDSAFWQRRQANTQGN